MGEAFFALNEDRNYLSNIVNSLIEEANLEALKAERAAAVQWFAEVVHLPDGADISKRSLAVLIELRARGAQIVRERGAVTVTMTGRGTSYVRSNEDIQRIGRYCSKHLEEA